MKQFKRLSFMDKCYVLLFIFYFAILIRSRYLNTVHNLAYWGIYSYFISAFGIIIRALIIMRLFIYFISFLYKDSLEENPKHSVMSSFALMASPFVFLAYLFFIILSFSFLDEVKDEKIIFENQSYIAKHDGGFLDCEIFLYEYRDSKFRAYLPSYSSRTKFSCPRKIPIDFEDSPFVKSPYFKKHDTSE